MSDPFKKVRKGDPLRVPAAAFNTLMDVGRDYQAGRLGGGNGGSPRGTPQTGIVLVKNNSGSDVDRFGVLGIDGPLFTPTDNANEFKSRVVLKGITPTTASHQGKFVILREPLKAGKIGEAYIAGVCPASVDFATSSDTTADVKNSDRASLQGGSSGSAKVLWKESGTGVKWAILLLGTPGNALAAFRVVSSTQDGSNKRWTYSLMRVEKTSAGYGGWTDVSGASAVAGYNVIEDQNGSSGTYGNGVVSTHLTGTFDIKPVPNGTRVFAEPVAVGGATEWWFQYENGVTGAC